jgi:hypothetical protein
MRYSLNIQIDIGKFGTVSAHKDIVKYGTASTLKLVLGIVVQPQNANT